MIERPFTVLVVDDEPPLRRILERALGRAGYRVLLAAGPEEGYALLNTEQPDALLLDIHMPTMSGMALYIAIINRWPALEGCIAIMTGDADADEVRTWLEHHRCMVIRKPFDLARVTDWLKDVARFRQRRTRNGSA
jgi:DNA-binding NtrC family response regulator